MFQNIDCGYSNRQFKEQVTPSVQLHFDGTNHWTMSFSSYKDENCVYYIDSLGANLKDLRNNVKIQLSQIYRTSSSILQVKVPRVQQQPNSYDCGLFGSARHAIMIISEIVKVQSVSKKKKKKKKKKHN